MPQSSVDPTVGYSVAYPMGVLGVILVAYVMQWVWKIDYRGEAQRLRGGSYLVEQEINNITLRVSRPEAVQTIVQELLEQHRWHVIFSRLLRDGHMHLVNGQTQFQLGDKVSVIGDPDEVAEVAAVLGEQVDEQLEAGPQLL